MSVQIQSQTVKPAIKHTEIIQLSPEAQKCFVEALLSPPEPGEALRRAFVLNDQLLREDDLHDLP
jgi:uncharacterized protein (DUF1778 family)